MSIQGYTSPGVQILETVNTTQAALASNPSVIALVGGAQGYQSATERDLLTGTTAVQLNNAGVSVGSVIVQTGVTGNTISPGAYKVATTDGSPTSASVYTIVRTTPPATAPTLTTGTGTLVGTYVYAVSFVNPAGETGIGPQSSQIVLATAGASLSAIPVDSSAGNGTTARNIYRAKVVGGVQGAFTLVGTVSGNVTTTLTNESTSDATAALAATPPYGIASGDTVLVNYQFTDENYFQPTPLDNYNDILNKYGAPFDANGNISSPLTFAARIAYQNGASEIICLAAASNSASDIATALPFLASQPQVRLVGVTSGDPNAASALAAHVTSMNSQGLFRQAIGGFDGSTTPVTDASMIAAAKAYNYEGLALVSPATFYMLNPVTGNPMKVGAQYAAAGILGMFAARDVQIALTRKTLVGFSDLADPRTPTQQALDSAAGLMVVRNQGGVLQIRHQTTTAVATANTAEFSVVRAKYEMGHRLEDALDAGVVGIVVPIENVPIIVNGVVTNILEALVLEGAISLYGSVSSSLTDPTTVTVSFIYFPAFPINNIIVSFSIDTNTGDFTSNIGTGTT